MQGEEYTGKRKYPPDRSCEKDVTYQDNRECRKDRNCEENHRKDGMQKIHIEGGTGVGRVTKPGLDQPVGNAAINHVPREMIKKEV